MVSKMHTFASVCLLSLAPLGLLAGALCSKSSEAGVALLPRLGRYRPTPWERQHAFVIHNQTAKAWRVVPEGEGGTFDELVDLKRGPAGRNRTFLIKAGAQATLAFRDLDDDAYETSLQILDPLDATRSSLKVVYKNGHLEIALIGPGVAATADGQRENEVVCDVANRTVILQAKAAP